MTTPKLDLDEAERLSREATAGPWDAARDIVVAARGEGVADTHSIFDAAFIAFARTFVPLAAARLRELEAQVDEANNVAIPAMNARITALEAQATEDEAQVRFHALDVIASTAHLTGLVASPAVEVLVEKLVERLAARKREGGENGTRGQR